MAELVSIKRNVDVSPGQAAPAVFHCSQGDVGSKIILGLLNNGTAYSIPSGVTVTIEGSESNGSIFTPISATASGSDITFYLTGEMTAVAGPAICQAVLKSGSNILGTANFTLEVESSPMGADAPPVFTDAGWTWMLNKLNTEFVPALGNETIIDAIDGKADQSDLETLENTVAGHTGSITVLNSTVNTLNQGVTKNRQDIATKLNKNQGTANAGKYLKVGTDGNIETADLDVTTDKTLSIADKAADAKAVGDELDDLKTDLEEIKGKVGLTEDVKSALLDCFAHVAWVNEYGRIYYDNLENALYPSASLVSISAVYTQSGAVYNTDTLDSLKADLVVTANMSDGTSQTVTRYTLSGTLAEGTSTITVTYSRKTTTFNVNVTQLLPSGYTLLKWIEADGNQYINTNIPETEEFAAEYAIYRTSDPDTVGGHILSSTNYYYPFLKGSTNTHRQNMYCSLRAGTQYEQSTSGTLWNLNTKYEVKCDWGNGADTVLLDMIDNEIEFSVSKGTTTNNANKLFFFAYGGAPNTVKYRYAGRFYYMRLYQNNVLVHDFYPCKNATNVVGLYDRTTGTFFQSDSGTALIAGEVA